MNNLDKILEKISAETDAEIERIQENTRKKREEITAQTTETIRQMEVEWEKQLAKEKEAVYSRGKAAASMRSREILLAQKASLLEEVYEKAGHILRNLPQETYISLLSGLSAEAIAERVNTVRFLREDYHDEAFFEEEAYSLVLSQRDREAIGEKVLADTTAQVRAVVKNPPSITLAVDTVPLDSGILIRYGDTQTTCSVPVLIAGLRDRLDPVITEILFG